MSAAVASDPVITSLEPISSSSVRVAWSQPLGGATVTGYVVYTTVMETLTGMRVYLHPPLVLSSLDSLSTLPTPSLWKLPQNISLESLVFLHHQ